MWFPTSFPFSVAEWLQLDPSDETLQQFVRQIYRRSVWRALPPLPEWTYETVSTQIGRVMKLTQAIIPLTSKSISIPPSTAWNRKDLTKWIVQSVVDMIDVHAPWSEWSDAMVNEAFRLYVKDHLGAKVYRKYPWTQEAHREIVALTQSSASYEQFMFHMKDRFPITFSQIPWERVLFYGLWVQHHGDANDALFKTPRPAIRGTVVALREIGEPDWTVLDTSHAVHSYFHDGKWVHTLGDDGGLWKGSHKLDDMGGLLCNVPSTTEGWFLHMHPVSRELRWCTLRDGAYNTLLTITAPLEIDDVDDADDRFTTISVAQRERQIRVDWMTWVRLSETESAVVYGTRNMLTGGMHSIQFIPFSDGVWTGGDATVDTDISEDTIFERLHQTTEWALMDDWYLDRMSSNISSVNTYRVVNVKHTRRVAVNCAVVCGNKHLWLSPRPVRCVFGYPHSFLVVYDNGRSVYMHRDPDRGEYRERRHTFDVIDTAIQSVICL